MTEQELYKLVESIVREELARRGAVEVPAPSEDAQRPPLLAVFT